MTATLNPRAPTPDPPCAARTTRRRTSASGRARRRMLRRGERAMFLADWVDVLFVHFAVDPVLLQPHVPFELDLFRGRAYVSLVAFTQRRLRPRVGGRLAALLSRPLAEHVFLNVRTYVRHGREKGIYFLAEWIPNRLACLVGPPMYGLPYRLARSIYACRAGATERGRFTGVVVAPAGRLAWSAEFRGTAGARPARRGLELFLLECYTAFTRRGDIPLRFHVWHEPWRRVRAYVALTDTSLLRAAFPWMPGDAEFLAHFSPGVRDVWIGPPRRAGRRAIRQDGARTKAHTADGMLGRLSENLGLITRATAVDRAAALTHFACKPRWCCFPPTKEVV